MEEYCECSAYGVCIFCKARQKKKKEQALMAVSDSISSTVLWIFGPKKKSIPGAVRPIDQLGKVLDRIFFPE